MTNPNRNTCHSPQTLPINKRRLQRTSKRRTQSSKRNNKNSWMSKKRNNERPVMMEIHIKKKLMNKTNKRPQRMALSTVMPMEMKLVKTRTRELMLQFPKKELRLNQSLSPSPNNKNEQLMNF